MINKKYLDNIGNGVKMKSISEEEDLMIRLVKNISSFLGRNCEVVLHDFTNGFDSTILAIENGHVTGREVGGCPTDLFFEMHRNNENIEDVPVYINTADNGRVLKSSTTVIRDDDGKVLGSLCINLDVTDLVMAQGAVRNFIGEKEGYNKEIFVKNVSELLKFHIDECQKLIGKPAAIMSRDEKLRAIEYLDDRGIFLITKSGARVCDTFNISKFTLYNYLDEIREKKARTIK